MSPRPSAPRGHSPARRRPGVAAPPALFIVPPRPPSWKGTGRASRKCSGADPVGTCSSPARSWPAQTPPERLFRNYDFRRLRWRGTGLATSESFYVAGRSLIGWLHPSLTGLISSKGRIAPKRNAMALLVETSSERSVSAAGVEDGTSAGIAQSPRSGSFYKRLNLSLSRSFRDKLRGSKEPALCATLVEELSTE